MAVRDADPDRDAAACAAIYAPHVLEGIASFETEAPSEQEMADRIRAAQRTHQWLVYDDGSVAGYAYASRHHERAAYRWSADVAVYVDGARRRSGVARALYTELIERLRAQRFRILCAGVSLPNDASVAFHESFGFVPVGVYREVGWKSGSWHDVGWWQLDLGRPADDPPPEPLPPG